MILKKSTEKERECLEQLMKDILRPYIPEFRGEVNKGGERILAIPCHRESWILYLNNNIFMDMFPCLSLTL